MFALNCLPSANTVSLLDCKAVKVLTVTHGAGHSVTSSAAETLQLVSQLVPSQPAKGAASSSSASSSSSSSCSSSSALPPLVSLEYLSALKAKGNEQFASKKFSESVATYTAAVDVFKALSKKDASAGRAAAADTAKIYCNRAAALAKLGKMEGALADCGSALQLDPSYEKARRRKEDIQSRIAAAAGR